MTMNNKSQQPIIEAIDIKKSFKQSDRQDLLVLDHLNFKLYPNEIVALLGKSGSGKSTLLRIIGGLTKPSGGRILYRGQPIAEPIKSLAMIFQSFALMPWITVLQNVELGLEALGLPREERRARALKAIDIVGLDGFESAYPKELSGGMRQRVGFARAIVVDPEILLMDEPFSALDVLTADNLRSDLLKLWGSKETQIKNILLVTHNIEEAVFLADRIIVLGQSPSSVRAELVVDIPHERNDQDPKFRAIVDHIYTLMTEPDIATTGFGYKIIDLGYRLPKVQISEITGFMDMLKEPEYRDRKVDLPELANELQMDVEDLFSITDALEILRFAKVSKGDIELSLAGERFAEADILDRKKIFASHLVSYVPLARHIRRILDERPGHRAKEQRFLNELEDYLSEEVAEEVLQTLIEWGRYAEIFAYDYNNGQLSLENPN
jgi:NitT/TauT family transport system ATP-binding protein